MNPSEIASLTEKRTRAVDVIFTALDALQALGLTQMLEARTEYSATTVADTTVMLRAMIRRLNKAKADMLADLERQPASQAEPRAISFGVCYYCGAADRPLAFDYRDHHCECKDTLACSARRRAQEILGAASKS